MTEDEKLAKQRAANRASYQKNKEKRLAQHRRWAAANPERMKELNARWYAEHREEALAKRRAYRAEHPEEMRVLVRRWYLDNKKKTIGTARQQRTGCTPEQYDALFAKQNGLCALCGGPPGKNALHADHCHTANRVRELLCHGCNTGLGNFKDDPTLLRAAADYIERHRL